MAGDVLNPQEVEEFRAGIRLAMTMGLPPEEADQPAFQLPSTVTNTAPADDDEVPFDPSAKPVVTRPPLIRVPCAVDYVDAAGKVVDFGVIQPSRALLTFLDVDYAKVKGFEWVLLGGDRFWYSKTPPPMGMGAVGVVQVYVKAEDDA